MRSPARRRPLVALRAFVVGLALLGGRGAFGQGGGDLAAARRLYAEAHAARLRGELELAAERYAAAYAITHDPALMLLVGEVAEGLGREARAVLAYEAYVEGLPGAGDRAEVERRIARLKGRIRARVGRASSGPGPAPGPAPGLLGGPRSVVGVVGWVAVGAAALLATGAGLAAIEAQETQEDLDRLLATRDPVRGRPLDFTAVEARLDRLRDDGERARVVAWSLGAAAGIAAVTSALLLVVDRRAPARVEVAPGAPGGAAGLSVRVRWP